MTHLACVRVGVCSCLGVCVCVCVLRNTYVLFTLAHAIMARYSFCMIVCIIIMNTFDKQINGLLKGGTSCALELFIGHVKITLLGMLAPSGPSVSGRRQAMH